MRLVYKVNIISESTLEHVYRRNGKSRKFGFSEKKNIDIFGLFEKIKYDGRTA